jgi:ligand-binding SRPBCC domain-containing protein
LALPFSFSFARMTLNFSSQPSKLLAHPMKLYTLAQVQHLPIPIDQAWQFFTDPNNLSRITPAWLDLRVVSASGASLYPGMIITFRVKPLWQMTYLWVTEITHVDAPHFFVDEMRFGPYRFWQHQHRFTETESGVEVKDVICYAVKGWPFGKILHHALIKPRLDDIFAFRGRILSTLFNPNPS